jgi:hypothetical protein
MRRLALVLAVLGICAFAGACDGSRGVTEPAGRVQNIGTIGSGHRDGTGGDSTATTQDNGGTIGPGHRGSVQGDSLTVTTRNGGTMGSGH